MKTMPARAETDGPVAIERPTRDRIHITVTDAGTKSSVAMSEHNAWRIFGMLSVMLEIPLSKTVGKAIKLSEPASLSGHEAPAGAR